LFSTDATDGFGLGRLCNDEIHKPTATMKKVEIGGKVALCLFALTDIEPGTEIRYHYGFDRDGSMPWRKVSFALLQ